MGFLVLGSGWSRRDVCDQVGVVDAAVACFVESVYVDKYEDELDEDFCDEDDGGLRDYGGWKDWV